MSDLKLLFLLKKNLESGGYSSKVKCSGLYNSASILAEQLRDDLGVETALEIVIDGNAIDKQLAAYKPDLAIIEAIWVTPEKIKELVQLHKKVVFVIRIHSEVPFLSNEGMAITWIKEYAKIPRTIVALNSDDTYRSFKALKQIKRVNYLPNIYDRIVAERIHRRTYLRQMAQYMLFPRRISSLNQAVVDIGCFGAIRPVKNQLIQAFAAIGFANRFGVKLRFHINSTRTEQGGESILKNLRALFNESEHELVEHPWMERQAFLKLVKKMDLGLQVSFNESFNIVAADFVSQGVPVVVSPAIKWMPEQLYANPVDTDSIDIKIEQCFLYRYFFKYSQYFALHGYNKRAMKEWKKFLK